MKQPFLGDNADISSRNFAKSFTPVMNPAATSNDPFAGDRPFYTGRYLATFDDPSAIAEHIQLFGNTAGMRVATTSDLPDASSRATQLDDADVLIYEQLGVALIGPEDDDQMNVAVSVASNRMIIEPELVAYVPDDVMVGVGTNATWGISAVKANISHYSGKDVLVAVLDTGFNIGHPDFNNRIIHSKSFVPNEAFDDKHGHGTHCIGTACGYQDDRGQRYGVAFGSTICAGKVLSNSGRGAQQWILDGMEWALGLGCKVISMSLGSIVVAGQGPNAAYERAAKDARRKGCIVVAAAGNESRRSSQFFAPVGSPANCLSVMAVAALNANLDVADFSNRAINAGIPGGNVDIAAPGENVYSSWPMNQRYRTISGTSMATPHVAGILAMLWEAYPNASPEEIIGQLFAHAQRLSLPSMDAGYGLAIAP